MLAVQTSITTDIEYHAELFEGLSEHLRLRSTPEDYLPQC